jgi:hypothetical protein
MIYPTSSYAGFRADFSFSLGASVATVRPSRIRSIVYGVQIPVFTQPVFAALLSLPYLKMLFVPV